MWIEEIEHVLETFDSKNLPPNGTVLDIGSEGLEYRTERQPWNQRIYQYFQQKSMKILTLDIDSNARPDYLIDITDPLVTSVIPRCDVVLAAHLLEHIALDLFTRAIDNIENLVRQN